jgi:hypothetical protein
MAMETRSVVISGPAASASSLPCLALNRRLSIQFPPCLVEISLTINALTQVSIQQGCRVDGDSVGEEYKLKFANGSIEDTWGRIKRKVTWSRQVPQGAYVRIVLEASSNPPPKLASTDDLPANSLSSIAVNRKNLQQAIADVARSEGGLTPDTCKFFVKAACVGDAVDAGAGTSGTGAAACCQWYKSTETPSHAVVSWADGTTQDLPIGTEIVLGPIRDNMVL